MQLIQQNAWFCSSRSQTPLLLESRILKIRQVFISFFEDRKRHFWFVFDYKPRSPRKGPSRTRAKCFVWYNFGDHSGPKAPLLDFTPLWYLFWYFQIFHFFLCFYLVVKKVSLALVKRTTLKNRCRRIRQSACHSSQNCNRNGGVPWRKMHFFYLKSDIYLRLDPIFDFFAHLPIDGFLQPIAKIVSLA